MEEQRPWPTWPLVAAAAVGGAVVGHWLARARGGPAVVRATNTRAVDKALLADVDAEQLNRVTSMYEADGMAAIRGAFVVVIGLGGVGSHAATALLRSGVGRLRLVDYDQVTVSSLNRHAVATREDVGVGKAECMARHFARIMPSTPVEVVREVFQASTAARLLAGGVDFVIDAIDNRVTKAQLIKACMDANIRFVSCMGAGARLDPSRVQVAFLSETQNDPLCRKMRVLLRHLHVNVDLVPVVYSSEPPPVKLLELEDEAAEKPEDYQLLPDFRIRIMPVVATVPAAVGCAAAAFVLNALSGKLQEQPMLPLKAAANRASKMVYDLVRSEDSARFASSRGERTMLVDDAVWVLTQVFSGRCAISGCVDDLTLRRWRLDRPASVSNVVVLSKKLAKKHQEAESLETLYSAEQIARVDGLLAREPQLVTRLKTWV